SLGLRRQFHGRARPGRRGRHRVHAAFRRARDNIVAEVTMRSFLPRAAALFSALPLLFAASSGPKLSVDAGAARHPISPDIYGINDWSDAGLATVMRIPVNRWGGDATSRYNWKNDTY